MNLWAALIGPGAFIAVMGTTMLLVRVTERKRSVPTVVAVVDQRTFRSAERYFQRLMTAG
jgi:hypothetical protein